MALDGSGNDGGGLGGPPVRASDGDRQRVADLLREHTTAGRLTMEEYEQRVDVAYAARTIVELRPLLADLPVRIDEVLPLAVVPAAAPQWAGPPGVAGLRQLRWVLYLAGVGALVGFVVLLSRGAVFWPLLVGVFFVFGGGGRRRHHRYR